MRAAGILFVLVAVAAAQPVSHPALWKYVHPKATILAGIDVSQVAASPLGRKLSSDFKISSWTESLSGQGLDFVSGVDRILLSSPGPASATARPQDAPVVVAVQGRFEPDKIRKFALAQGGQSLPYKGVNIMLAPKSEGDMAVALVSAQVLLTGDLSSVKAALDHHAAFSPEAAAAPLFARATELNTLYEVWFVSQTPIAGFGLPASPGLQPLADVQGFEGGLSVREGLGLELNLQTASPEAAKMLAETAQVMLQFANAGPARAPALTDLLKRLRIQPEEDRVAFSIAWSQSQVEAAVGQWKTRFFKSGPQVAHSPKPPAVPEPLAAVAKPATPPAPPVPMVVKIYGLEGGTREVVLPQ